MTALASAKRGLLVVVLAVAGLASCEAGGIAQPADARLVAMGRAERGLSLRVALIVGGDTVRLSGATVTVSPPGAAVIRGDSAIELRSAGALTLTARLADGTTIYNSLTIATPPMIAFDMLVDGNRDIYVAALDGAGLTRLTSHPAEDMDPTVAGGRVVYVSYRSGSGELYARSASPGGADALIVTATGVKSDPALSQDGTRLAFVVDAGEAPKVWVANANGSSAARLTSTFGSAGSAEFSPTWSPSRDRVAFTGTAHGVADLFSSAIGSSATDTLLKEAATIARPRVEPAWFADGSLAFVGAEQPAQVFVRRNGSIAAATDCAVNCGQPAWLEDGRIVFTMFSSGSTRLGWVDPAEGAVIHLIPLPVATVQRPAAIR